MPPVDNKTLVKKSQEIFKEMGIEVKTTQLYEFFSKIQGETNWNLAKSKNINFLDFINQTPPEKISPSFKTGNFFLDSDYLINGLHKGSSAVIVSQGGGAWAHGFMTAVTCGMMKENGAKVLEVFLEGMEEEVSSRYAANFLGKDYPLFFKNEEAKKERDSLINEFKSKNSLRIKNGQGLRTISDLTSLVSKSFEENPFDVLVINLPQILSPSTPGSKQSEVLGNIYHELNILAKKLNILILSTVSIACPESMISEGQYGRVLYHWSALTLKDLELVIPNTQVVFSIFDTKAEDRGEIRFAIEKAPALVKKMSREWMDVNIYQMNWRNLSSLAIKRLKAFRGQTD